ncbi:MAG: TVP38/TMEM64 family protein [Clostridia bacterium]|nr:TVP38/TMEM64 family protein [Clostridia bacterium]
MKKVWETILNNKKKILTILVVLVTLVAISVLAMLLLVALDIIYFDDGMYLNEEIFDDFMKSWYGWVILILLQVLITSLLCFIPGASMAFIILIQAFFKKSWQAFLIAYSGVLLSSIIMYSIGRIGGYKICEKLLGKEDCQKASELLNHKGAVYFPLMMLFPIFPDDALVMIAGTLKMSMKWFAPSILICRSMGVATIIFGLSIISFDKFTTPWHWIGFISLCIALLVLVFYLAYLFNKYLEKRGEVKKSSTENDSTS